MMMYTQLPTDSSHVRMIRYYWALALDGDGTDVDGGGSLFYPDEDEKLAFPELFDVRQVLVWQDKGTGHLEVKLAKRSDPCLECGVVGCRSCE